MGGGGPGWGVMGGGGRERKRQKTVAVQASKQNVTRFKVEDHVEGLSVVWHLFIQSSQVELVLNIVLINLQCRITVITSYDPTADTTGHIEILITRTATTGYRVAVCGGHYQY